MAKKPNKSDTDAEFQLKEPFWNKQKGEDVTWFARFQSYLQAGITRSILGTYKREKVPDSKDPEGDTAKRSKINRTPNAWSKWSKFYKWEERAEAFDLHILEEDQKRWEEKHRANREDEQRLGDELADRARAILNLPIMSIEVEENKVIDPISGNEYVLVKNIFRPVRADMRSGVLAADMASQLRRRATGNPVLQQQQNLVVNNKPVDTTGKGGEIRRIFVTDAPTPGSTKEEGTEERAE